MNAQTKEKVNLSVLFRKGYFQLLLGGSETCEECKGQERSINLTAFSID